MNIRLVVASGSRAGQQIPISGENFIIGRSDDCHLKPRSELISRYHCSIVVGTDVAVRDLGSKNGVYVNGERISSERILKNGDRLMIGPLEFFMNISADEAGSAEEQVKADTCWLRKSHDGTGESGTDTAYVPPNLLEQLKAQNAVNNAADPAHPSNQKR